MFGKKNWKYFQHRTEIIWNFVCFDLRFDTHALLTKSLYLKRARHRVFAQFSKYFRAKVNKQIPSNSFVRFILQTLEEESCYKKAFSSFSSFDSFSEKIWKSCFSSQQNLQTEHPRCIYAIGTCCVLLSVQKFVQRLFLLNAYHSALPNRIYRKEKKKRPKNWKNGLALLTVWKIQDFTHILKRFVLSKNSWKRRLHRKYVSFITHQLISRNFCKEILTVTFCNFHVVCYLLTRKEYHCTSKVSSCLLENWFHEKLN